MRLGALSEGRDCDRSSLCAQHAGLDERAFQKIILQRQLADLGVQCIQVDRRLHGRLLTAEHVGRSREPLVLPVGDLVGMHVMLLRQLG